MTIDDSDLVKHWSLIYIYICEEIHDNALNGEFNTKSLQLELTYAIETNTRTAHACKCLIL